VTRVLLVLLLALGSLPAAPAGAQPAGDPVLVAVGDISPDPFRPWLGAQDDLDTADDTRGVLQPGNAGVITARFELPAGAEPAVLYVAEAGGGEPVPVAIP